MDRNRGDKRRRIPLDRARDILALVSERVDGATRPVPLASGMEEAVVSRVFPARLFGYRTITVERPFRLNFGAFAERRRRLETERAFAALALSKKRGEAKALEEAAGRELQQQIGDMLAELPDALVKDWAEFNVMLSAGAKRHGLKLAAPIRKAILSALSERDASAEICGDADGHPEPDPELRDTESVPLEVGDDPADEERVPASVRRYFAREVLPHVPDAWIDLAKRDPSDGLVGLVGYELNFNRYLYRYTPPRPLEASQADIRSLEGDIVRLLAEVTGGADE
jgi:type I restriction enzyme M protein